MENLQNLDPEAAHVFLAVLGLVVLILGGLVWSLSRRWE